jgi:hypothetical protein
LRQDLKNNEQGNGFGELKQQKQIIGFLLIYAADYG